MLDLFVWGALFIVLILVESATTQLVSIWFAVGSLVALIVAIFNDALGLQALLFLVVSIALLFVTRPFLKQVLLKQPVATNADAVIGREGLTVTEIDNLKNTGRVQIQGLSWNARSIDNVIIPVEQKIKVIHMEGVTVFVRPVEENK